jgi:hypothetical protein
MLDKRHVAMTRNGWNVEVFLIVSSHSEASSIASATIKSKGKWADGLSPTDPDPLGDITDRLSSFGTPAIDRSRLLISQHPSVNKHVRDDPAAQHTHLSMQ